MKKLMRRAFCSVFALAMAFSMVGCSTPDDGSGAGGDNTGGGGGTEIVVDKDRTQLYVYNYNGGYGTEWLSNAIKDYEELHKNDVYEPGKVGIQIVPNPTKDKPDATKILSGKDEVYFAENVQYYQWINSGALADISDAVTKNNPYETSKTVESKLTDEQKEFYGYKNGNQTTYYGLPHYSGSFGIVYDIDLFNSKGFYFRDGYNKSNLDLNGGSNLTKCFISKTVTTKSAGPDGVKGTTDDGLPATYDEFIGLCEYIYKKTCTPIFWSGANYAGYLTMLYNQLVVNDAGMDTSLKFYTMDGDVRLGTVNASGEFVEDAADTRITPDNAYELYRHESKYTALKFLETLIKKDKYYSKVDNIVFSSTHEQLVAQEDFLWAGKEAASSPIAMFADGVWWQSEANEVFKAMEDEVSAWGKNNRNFGWMPLPRAEQSKAKNVYFDHLNSMCFVKKNIPSWKLDIAIDFIQFVHTDENLKMFTKTTNTPKAYNYTMEADDLEELTPFGRSVIEFKQKADVMYPFSSEPRFLNNQAMFGPGEGYKAALSIDQNWPVMSFHENDVTAAEYFSGMYDYYKREWPDA